MGSTPLLDRAGRPRSPATLTSFHQGLVPGNKGLRYPPDPPTVGEIVAVMRAAGNRREGVRLRGVIVVLRRAGLRISEALVRAQLHHAAAIAGVRRRFAPHQLRHAHAVEMWREGISLIVIQRQLGHAGLAITSQYLRGMDNTEILAAVHERPAPMIPADRTRRK